MIPGPHADVLPQGDADFGLFVNQFSAAFVPSTFNTVLPAASTLVTLAANYAAALALATDPTTRTPVTVAAKDAIKLSISATFRSAIRAVQTAFLDGICTAAQALNCGVRPNSLTRAPILAPVYAPLIAVDASFAGSVRFRVTQVDQLTGSAVTTRGYSYGLVGVELQRKVLTDPFVARQIIKRVLVSDSTADLAAGVVASYRARYVTARGLRSPFSPVVVGVVQ